MPVPKRRHSKRRRNTRRAHDAIKAPNVVACPECGEPMQSHRVCPECGFYKGRQVVETEEE